MLDTIKMGVMPLQILQNTQKEIQQYQKRLIIIAVLMGLLICLLIARLFYLQVGQSARYVVLSRQNALSVMPIAPHRGLIYDRRGVLLAGNLPVFSLEVIPKQAGNIPKALHALSSIITLSDTDLQLFHKQLAQRRRFNTVPLKMQLSMTERATFAVNQYRFPGFFIQAQMMRYYPFSTLTAPVIGYIGRINTEELKTVDPVNYSATNYFGKTGIEKYAEKSLHGVAGVQQIEATVNGNAVHSHASRSAVAGDNIYLTIDIRLQAAIQKILKDQAGGVIVLNPHNGEILASVSQPSFDPNLFVSGISHTAYQVLNNNPHKPLFNRITQGEFPPGSTVKPLYALKALETGVVSPEDYIFDPGFFKLPNSSHIYHDWRRAGHGWVNLEKAITESCDVYFFHLAHKMGIKNIDNVLTEFGFGQSTGIDIYAEKKGLVPSPEWKKRVHHHAWFPGDTVISGIGQGYLLVTPLQLSTAMMRLVNEGQAYLPHFLLKTEKITGQIEKNAIVRLKSVDYPKPIWAMVLNAMREVVSRPDGTAYQAGKNAPYTFGGKTGTAQVFSLKKNQTDKANLLPQKLRDHSWFMGFAPAQHPAIVLVIFLEHGGEGKAAELARPILDSYFKLYGHSASK